ncbi:MAG: SRPBCC family protein [Bacteroidota bacterium]
MSILSSKWMIGLGILLLILIVVYAVGRKSAHAEIMIPATKEKIWNVLTDASAVKEWNTILIPLEGTYAEGNKIKYEFRQEGKEPAIMDATVAKMLKEELLNQKGGLPLVITFDHKYMLEEVEGGTKLTIHEEYRGLMVPFWDPSGVEKAYAKLADALKKRVTEIK